MKAIILSAGRGSRMGELTQECPKGMLPILGVPILQRQINTLREFGIDDIHVVRGYLSHKITMENITYWENEKYLETNMIYSLMCAQDVLDDDIIVTYGDILYEKQLIKDLIAATSEISVSVDKNWRSYWMLRYGTTEFDLETLKIDGNNITDIGRSASNSSNIDCRYIGVIKFSKSIISKVLEFYKIKEKLSEKWVNSENDFYNGYMTDLLFELSTSGVKVQAVCGSYNWIELDTRQDYEVGQKLASKWIKNGARYEQYSSQN